MSLSTGVYFLVLLQIGMPEFSPGSTEYSLQTITAPPHPSPPADCTAVFHPAMQPHLLGATALRCARLNSNGSTALPDITIAMQYMTRHYWRSCNKFGSRILFFSVHALVHLLKA